MWCIERIIGNHLAALHGLQKSVVQITCDSRPLCQPFIEANRERMRHLTDSQSIDSPYDQDKGSNNDQLEPVRLVPRWKHTKLENGTLLIPYSVVIRRHYAKTVLAGTKISVKGLTTPICLLPRFVVTFKLVPEVYLLWNGVTQRRIVDLHIPRESRETKLILRRILLCIGDDFPNVHRRRKRIF